MITDNFTHLSRVWRVCYGALRLAVITATALCVTSCTTTRRVTTSSWELTTTKADSQRVAAVVHEMHKVTHQAIPADTATLTLPLESLRNLPEGITLSQRKGRATAGATLKNGQLHITANCDSLQREVEHYSMMAAAYASEVSKLRHLQAQQAKVEKKRSTPFWQRLVLLSLIAVGASFIFLFILKKNKRHV